LCFGGGLLVSARHFLVWRSQSAVYSNLIVKNSPAQMESLSHVLLLFSLSGRAENIAFLCAAARPFLCPLAQDCMALNFMAMTHTRQQRQSRQVFLCAIFCTIFLLVNFYFSLPKWLYGERFAAAPCTLIGIESCNGYFI
jgi:hypothetical protein